MSDNVISVENLGKSYEIKHQGSGLNKASYSRLNEEMGRALLAPFRRLVGKPPPEYRVSTETFWALRDVSFALKRGARVGMSGRNGAGKSTLLKILSRIVMPTTGRMEISGKIASLLEVGTGFHQELTGRENIFLNGSIFGLKRYQIQQRYDEIVEFSGVEKFLDTPVKRYSSGMQVRLAFSVAAHLDPEVMIIDEVLAVGDARFQKKCLGKMNEVSQNFDRTIIFVTHTMGFVEALCNRVISLDQGRLVKDSYDVQSVVHDYLESMIDKASTASVWVNPGNVLENEFVKINRIQLAGGVSRVANDRPIIVEMEIDLLQAEPRLLLGMALFSDENTLIFLSYNADTDPEMPSRMQPGIQTLRCAIPPHFLNERAHRIEFSAMIHQGPSLTERGSCPACIKFAVAGGLSESPYWTSRRAGSTAPLLDWELV